jgi:prepilin-type N-terminal cleavage/methylation domain-containing protein
MKRIFPQPDARRAFSLLEVMIALAIFFMAAFAILELVSSGLRTARAIRITRPNAGTLAAELSITNKLEEGTESGDFGNLYPDYSWTQDSYPVPEASNGLWQVDFTIYRRGHRGVPDSRMSILMFSPQSQSRRLGLQP